MMSVKKIKKFIFSPKSRLTAFLKKRNNRKYISPKYAKDGITYSVVSAVYNVAPYIEKFLSSLIIQTIGFEKHIEVILVDDGSTDDSAKIAKNWVAKYPKNIKLIQKENGGAASARNLGLKHVQGEWVTFIDPDDWVSESFFYRVDQFLYENFGSFDILVTKLVKFMEKTGEVQNTHSLAYRFGRHNRILNILSNPKYFQVHASPAFFKTSIIEEHQLHFDESIRPSFEDAKFILEYFRRIRSFRIGFCPYAIYYYRKRALSDSQLDSSYQTHDIFLNKIRRSHLDAFEKYLNTFGFLPEFLQLEILYDIGWLLKRFIGKDQDLPILSDYELKEAWDLLKKALLNISPDVIEYNEFRHITPEICFGCLHTFRLMRPKNWGARLDENPSPSGRLVLSLVVSPEEKRTLIFRSGNNKIDPVIVKRNSYSFLKRPFYDLFTIILPSDFGPEPMSMYLEDEKIPIYRKNRVYTSLPPTIKAELEQRQSRPKPRKLSQELIVYAAERPFFKHLYQDAWLIMDRDVNADDNGEHLYRYIMSLEKDKRPNIFFVLNRDSHDWIKLKNDGFRLLPHGSLKHYIAVLNAKWIISSQTGQNAKPLQLGFYRDKLKYNCAILRNNMLKVDLPKSIAKQRIALVACTTIAEYDSLLNGSYKIGTDELVLTGLPRHDLLKKRARANQKPDLILIMPTWRRNLHGPAISNGEGCFKESTFFSAWQSLLAKPELMQLANHHGYNVGFFKHINMQMYIKKFTFPNEIILFSHTEGSVQDLFARCALLITDYSPVAFEVALIDRPVIYFQFDSGVYFSSLATKKGCFDYYRDGFGPVVSKTDDVLHSMEEILDNSSKMLPIYQKRRDLAFPEKSISSCEGVYRELLNRSF